MKKKCLLLLLGVSMLVASGCGKKETVTAEELLGNPYGSAVESGDFDIEVNLTASGKEYALKGNVQFDKSGLHFKGNQSGEGLDSAREYYIIKNGNEVKRYNFTPSTGRWGLEEEETLDTSGYLAPAVVTDASLNDYVLMGKTTVGQLGSLGVCPICWVKNQGVELADSVPLSVEYTFDKDTKQLRVMKFAISEAQPGGLTAYSVTVTIKSVNNISVSVPTDISANAIVGGSSGSSGVVNEDYYGKSMQPLPDEYKGYVLVEANDPLIDIAKELNLEVVEYNGVYLMDVPNYNTAYDENAERQGMTVIVNPEESSAAEGASEEETTTASDETTESAEETSAVGSTESVGGGTPEEKPSSAPSDMSLGDLCNADWETQSDYYSNRWPSVLGTLDEGGIDFYVNGLKSCIENPEYTLSTYAYWSVSDDLNKMVCAMAIDLGVFTKEQCVAAGASASDIDACLARLR